MQARRRGAAILQRPATPAPRMLPLRPVARRDFLAHAARATLGATLGTALGASAACKVSASGVVEPASDGRLASRPTAAPRERLAPGVHDLAIVGSRAAQLYVPAGLDTTRPAPLLVLLHGAGRDATEWTSPAAATGLLDQFGTLLLAPSSSGGTWSDRVDVGLVDRALRVAFDAALVDPARLGIGGFSDGASFGLSLGLANGDLFPHSLAFSPGYLVSFARVGRPRVFVSHGRADAVLPFAGAAAIVESLRRASYPVEFVEFDGGHTIGVSIMRRALEWLGATAR